MHACVEPVQVVSKTARPKLRSHRFELEPPPSGSNRRNSARRYLVEVDFRLGVGRRDGCGRVVTRRGRTESGESPEEDGADHGGSTGGSDATVRDRRGAGRYAGVVCHVVSPRQHRRRLPPERLSLLTGLSRTVGGWTGRKSPGSPLNRLRTRRGVR